MMRKLRIANWIYLIHLHFYMCGKEGDNANIANTVIRVNFEKNVYIIFKSTYKVLL